jgi:hypothetical protein
MQQNSKIKLQTSIELSTHVSPLVTNDIVISWYDIDRKTLYYKHLWNYIRRSTFSNGNDYDNSEFNLIIRNNNMD